MSEHTQSAHDDRLALAIRALSAPREYIRPWYVAYLLLGMVTAGLLPVLLPLAAEALSHQLATVAYVVGAYNFGLLTSPVWGALAELRKLYRQVFLGGFLLTALAITALPLLRGSSGWIGAAFAIGAGSGGAATLATMFVVDFAPRPEWEPRIGWLQSFNAAGQVVGLLLAAIFSGAGETDGLWLAAAVLIPAILVGGIGLPVARRAWLPGIDLRNIHRVLDIRDLSVFPRIDLPSDIVSHIYRLNWQGIRQLPRAVGTPFGRFLLSWSVLAFAVASFFSYFPLMLAKSYGIAVHASAAIYALAAALSIGLYVLAGGDHRFKIPLAWGGREHAAPKFRRSHPSFHCLSSDGRSRNRAMFPSCRSVSSARAMLVKRSRSSGETRVSPGAQELPRWAESFRARHRRSRCDT